MVSISTMRAIPMPPGLSHGGILVAVGVGLACVLAAGALPACVLPCPDELAAGALGAAGAEGGVVCARRVCGAAESDADGATAWAIWLTGWLTGACGGAAAARVVGVAGAV